MFRSRPHPRTLRPGRAAAAAAAFGVALFIAAVPGSSGAVTGAGAAAPKFGPDLMLGAQSGEPSIAVDTTNKPSRGFVYVEAIGGRHAPQEWHSYDGGKTFSKPQSFDVNGPLRGGDGDVVVNTNGDVIVTDLDLSHAWVQISTDHGKSFNAGTATAPEDDRPWLTADGQTVYVAYHDFVAEVPVVCTSTDDGQSFDSARLLPGPVHGRRRELLDVSRVHRVPRGLQDPRPHVEQADPGRPRLERCRHARAAPHGGHRARQHRRRVVRDHGHR